MQKLKTLFRYLLSLFFIAAGINHFWHTPFYVAMMPPYLPAPLALVYLSGVAEIGLGALLLFRRGLKPEHPGCRTLPSSGSLASNGGRGLKHREGRGQ